MPSIGPATTSTRLELNDPPPLEADEIATVARYLCPRPSMRARLRVPVLTAGAGCSHGVNLGHQEGDKFEHK
jgi:hypothetical protein